MVIVVRGRKEGREAPQVDRLKITNFESRRARSEIPPVNGMERWMYAPILGFAIGRRLRSLFLLRYREEEEVLRYAYEEAESRKKGNLRMN